MDVVVSFAASTPENSSFYLSLRWGSLRLDRIFIGCLVEYFLENMEELRDYLDLHESVKNLVNSIK